MAVRDGGGEEHGEWWGGEASYVRPLEAVDGCVPDCLAAHDGDEHLTLEDTPTTRAMRHGGGGDMDGREWWGTTTTFGS